MESVNKHEEKCVSVMELMFHSTSSMTNGNLLKSCVSVIRVKQICINQGVGVILNSSNLNSMLTF